MPIVFRVKRWLEEEEFQELLKVADYLGYEAGYKKFKVNIEKALRNGYLVEDVKGLLEEYAAEIEGSMGDVERALEDYYPVFEWSPTKGVIRIRLSRLVYNVVKEHLKRTGSKRSEVMDDKVVVEVLPYYVQEVANYFKNLGLRFIDVNNILREKHLGLEPELKGVKLRPYQEEALDKWFENKCRGVIALPTGSGKSLIAIAAIVRLRARTLIVAYTKEQVFQWRDFILEYTTLPAGIIGLFYGEEKRLAPITITTYQSGFRNINAISPHFSMIVVDEVHHLPAEKFRHIALHSLATYRMGLSATPTREDGKHEELFPLLGGIVYYKSPSELAEKGYLAPYAIITIKVKMSPQERKLYEELRRRYRALAGGKKFQEILEEARRGNPKAAEALGVHSEMKMLLAKSIAKIEKAVELALSEYKKGSKVIVFTQYVDQAKEVAKRLGSLLLTGDTPEAERKNVLEVFRNSSQGILVVTTVGDEGLDIPDANVGIIVSGTGSRRQFIQRLGRLLRPKASGVRAVLYEIVLERTPEEYYVEKHKLAEMGDFI
ncbi:MAG: DEAD/DEAH box helicase [Desulfurococcaceae archaeon]